MESVEVKTFIGEDIEIIGSVKCAGHIHVDGKLNGDLTCNGDVILGVTGAIKGNTNVNAMTVAGTVNGNIVARDKVELKATAKLTGDIRAKRMTMEDGVSFVGKAEITPAQGKAADAKPATEIAPESSENSDSQDSKTRGIFGRR